MNRFLIGFFAFILTLSSAFSEVRPVLEIDFQEQETLDSIPTWSTDNFILTSSKKSAEAQIFPGEALDPVSAPTEWITHHNHLYYLPIYALVRQKEYFLLI